MGSLLSTKHKSPSNRSYSQESTNQPFSRALDDSHYLTIQTWKVVWSFTTQTMLCCTGKDFTMTSSPPQRVKYRKHICIPRLGAFVFFSVFLRPRWGVVLHLSQNAPRIGAINLCPFEYPPANQKRRNGMSIHIPNIAEALLCVEVVLKVLPPPAEFVW